MFLGLQFHYSFRHIYVGLIVKNNDFVNIFKSILFIMFLPLNFRSQYFEEQLKTWKICIFTCSFTAFISIAMNIFTYLSLFYFLSTHDAETSDSRPLLFPFWMPNVDFSKTPVYEIAFMFANICVLLYAYGYICKLCFNYSN